MTGHARMTEHARIYMNIKRIEKPWGYEEIWAQTDRYVGKYLVIKSPHRLSFQYHEKKEETIRLLEGVMDLEVENSNGREVVRLNCGQTFHIPPGTRHRMIAIEDCVVLEVSTPELDDVVRLEDDYGRIR
jgi:mannose-6-phosphate isomerase